MEREIKTRGEVTEPRLIDGGVNGKMGAVEKQILTVR